MKSLLLLILLPAMALSNDLGAIGETYQISEPDMLQHIKHTIEQQRESFMQTWKEQQVQAIKNLPASVNRVRRHTHSFYFLPVLPNIIDAKAKTKSVLSDLPDYHPHWVFFNGHDERQVAFARREVKRHPQATLVLTGGDYLETVKHFTVPVYVDQQGKLSRHFTIQHVPARLQRDGERLRITEFGEGDY